MVTGVIQAGSSLGILVPPSVVLVLYAMIARQPVGQLWLAGVLPGLMMAGLFVVYIVIRCGAGSIRPWARAPDGLSATITYGPRNCALLGPGYPAAGNHSLPR